MARWIGHLLKHNTQYIHQLYGRDWKVSFLLVASFLLFDARSEVTVFLFFVINIPPTWMLQMVDIWMSTAYIYVYVVLLSVADDGKFLYFQV